MPQTVSRPQLSDAGRQVERHWKELAAKRRLYTLIGVGGLVFALSASLWYANEANAGKFFDRLPHLLDFVSWLVPSDWNDVWRAFLDLPTPNADGTEAMSFEGGRVYLTESLYVPEYVHKMLETINIAILATLIGFVFGFVLCFLAAQNTAPSLVLRAVVRRIMEIFRAFPEIVIAGFFAAVLSLGPIPAIIAVAIHTIGALGKMFFEVAENADMKAEEGLRAVGAPWILRMRYGLVPHVLPNFLSYALLRLEINVRASTIIGAVGGGGIGEILRLSIGRGWGAQTIAIISILFVTVIVVDQVSASLRRRLVGAEAFSPVA
ncbi:phosphonate ABC transporter, permease protein PhnE [Chthonobacter albigriseus]|uniref:phosphonate ABC transporter, permease protein PhnE n=1 Tax=Chthonobacter albigriseus TaxID=1683161 RepID=UPI0015EF5E4A|nr:phosphonate ABC transporter, permease protein PhnE [Chthonobacter albigriseus]